MKNKKGFTLVEIIVVLVILAILAAIAVPSVIGYVNEAKESRYIQEAHSIYTVVETEVAKYRARNGNTYKMYWISDDAHHIEATLTKNKDVKIVSTDSNHNFD